MVSAVEGLLDEASGVADEVWSPQPASGAASSSAAAGIRRERRRGAARRTVMSHPSCRVGFPGLAAIIRSRDSQRHTLPQPKPTRRERSTVIDRPRAWNLGISAACFAAFAVIAALVVQTWQPLVRIDDEGKPARNWAGGHDELVTALRVVEHGFGTIGITILTVIVTVAAAHPRPAPGGDLHRRRDDRQRPRHHVLQEHPRPRPPGVAGPDPARREPQLPQRAHHLGDRVLRRDDRAGHPVRTAPQPADRQRRRDGARWP